MFGRLFGRKKAAKEPENDYDEEAEMEWDRTKSQYLESLLGPEHDIVMHAIIPFAVGGGLDLYYYPKGLPGTAIATKELVDRQGGGPENNVYPCYELVMLTRQQLDLDQAKDDSTPFGAAHSSMNSILNLIARYCTEAKLNPNETCEFPQDMEHVGGKCLIFDTYSPADNIGPNGMGLLLIIEVFRSEMTFAMDNGGEQLLQKLKDAGHYPHSDLDRPAVA